MIDERHKEVQKLAIDAYMRLEPSFKELAEQLKTPMELAYFLNNLENRVAIAIGMKMK